MSKGLEKRKLASDVLDYLDDDSVSGNKENEVKKVPVEQLVPFHNHPFKLYEGQRLDDMVESIREHGIMIPLLVRMYKGKMEILSGHNRLNAAILAGLTEVPVIEKVGLSEKEAYTYVIETNLMPETESGNENQDENMEETENNTKESQTDNTTNAVISNEDVNAAVLRVYESVCSYMNNSGVTEFNTNDIRTMYENWEMVKGLDIFEKPIDMEEYVAMRSGQTVSFYYDAGVQLIWNVEADTVDIIYNEE